MATLAAQFAGLDACRTPLDARYFDESAGVVTITSAGLLYLARFELPFGYCGALEGFWQFTNAHAQDNAEISTPTIEWLLRINGQPVAPYLGLRTILQPWGWPTPRIAIRLPLNAVLEFAVRVLEPPQAPPEFRVAGRIFGRYWFDEES
jgi:hypothetical protein